MSVAMRIVWTLGFLIGTATHSLDLWQFGWLPYDFRPLPWNIYWTSLTFFDPLAALLVWLREPWGVILGVVIMASNVLVNGYTAFVLGYEAFYFSFALQSGFAAFVFFAAWRHWQGRTRPAEAS